MDLIQLRCKILSFLIDGGMRLPGRFEPRSAEVRQAIAPEATLGEYEEAMLRLFAEGFVTGEDAHTKTFSGRIYRFYIESVTSSGLQFREERCEKKTKSKSAEEIEGEVGALFNSFVALVFAVDERLPGIRNRLVELLDDPAAPASEEDEPTDRIKGFNRLKNALRGIGD